MKKRFKDSFRPDMLRPMLYKAFARFLYALTAALLWHAFVGGGRSLQFGFAFLSMLFVLCAWIAHLRRNGARLPRLSAQRLRRRREVPLFDMIDHVDEPVVTFADLTKEEQDLCLLLADGINAIVFFALSFFF